MSDSCQNCGAELYEGQQFCRRCGVPVGAAASGGGEAPTQLFPAGAQTGAAAAPARTAPLGGGAHADSVARQQPTAYQPPASQQQQTSALVGQPFGSQPLAVGAPPAPRRRRRGVWLVALLVVFVLGAGIASAAAFFWWRATRGPIIVRRMNAGGAPPAPAVPDIPKVPGIPENFGDRIKEALKSAGVPLPLDESGAVVSGDDTTLTRTFELGPDSSFSAYVATGNVTVIGSDADEAVVKVVKHGGSAEERAALRVMAAESDEGVMLLSAAPPSGRVTVSYEVSLPRGLHKLAISADRGDVKVSEFDGELDVNLAHGSVSVSTNGAVRSRVTNGKTSVAYAGRHREPQEFSVVNGDVDVFLTGSGQEVDLKAAATNGRVEVGDTIAAKAERRGAGQRVEAELGGGGAPLEVKVVNGNIRLKQ